MKNIVIITPVYNDWESFTKLINEINRVISGFKDISFSLIAINDGSKEKAPSFSLPSHLKVIEILNMRINQGHAICIANGIKYALKNYQFDNLILMDADGEDRPEEISDLINKARELQNELLKPKGSLGKLEEYAIWMAGWQKKINPSIENAHCLIFAGNHGVARKGVSAFPSEVTEQMVENFKKGGAAINQLCELAGLKLNVLPLDLDEPTKDFSENFAMDKEEVISAMQTGFDSVPSNCDLLVLGEMGISNTTSASALSCALFNEKVENMTGTGTCLLYTSPSPRDS